MRPGYLRDEQGLHKVNEYAMSTRTAGQVRILYNAMVLCPGLEILCGLHRHIRHRILSAILNYHGHSSIAFETRRGRMMTYFIISTSLKPLVMLGINSKVHENPPVAR